MDAYQKIEDAVAEVQMHMRHACQHTYQKAEATYAEINAMIAVLTCSVLGGFMASLGQIVADDDLAEAGKRLTHSRTLDAVAVVCQNTCLPFTADSMVENVKVGEALTEIVEEALKGE